MKKDSPMRTLPGLLLTLIALSACKDADDAVGTDSVASDDTGGEVIDDTGGADDTGSEEEVDRDGDNVPSHEDCDDDNAAVYPGAEELCDELDNDCNGSVDDGAGSEWYTDSDGDGYGAGAVIIACDQPEGAVAQGEDCDDNDAAFNPGAAETECTDPNDYNCDGSVGFEDGDGDGFAACEECDDSDAAVNPKAEEVCDELDNNCDGSVDEGVTSTYYQDKDADTYGDTDFPVSACEAPAGYSSVAEDCDDAATGVNPGAQEVCSGVDEDCDGLIDDADDSLDAASGVTSYSDDDGDGFGDPGSATVSCEAPSGNVSDASDCDDRDGAVSPDAEETCDELDNNCDGAVDEAGATGESSWYADTDGDGYGDADSATTACEAPEGAVANADDCDDGSAAVSPAASEVCDSVDNNCDGVTDTDAIDLKTYYADADGDGEGDVSVTSRACSRPSGYIGNKRDCDDSDAAISTGAAEVCDDADNDCDTVIDEGFDADGDSITDCNEISYTVVFYGTGDDDWDGYVDGVYALGDGGWSTVESVTMTLDSGDHTLAAYVSDTGAAIAGFLAAVSIDGTVTYVTGGAGDWLMVDNTTASDWAEVDFDDSSWTTPLLCASSDVSSRWGSAPASLRGLGAQWVWHQSCTALGDSFYRLNFSLP
jgi:hypothetical protein